MKKLSLLFLLVLTISAQSVFAGAGVYNGWVTIGETTYNLGTAAVALNNADLGAFTHGSSKSITYTEADVWRDNNNGNICSAQLYYKITGTGSTSYTGTDKSTGSMGYYQHINNTNKDIWRLSTVTSNSDILSGLSPGTYNIAFWISATGSTTNNACSEYLYLNNTGSNYVATFTINPVVTFNSNGGTGTMANQSVTYNTATELSANSFTRTGYTFNGWTTNADGTGTVYANKANITITANTTLYAKWKAVPTITSVTSSPGSSSQTYKGATITITGTSLLDFTTVKLGGSGGTTITGATKTATSITFTVPDGTTGGTVYLSDGTYSYTSTESFTNLGYISTATTGNWSATGTWLGSSVPVSTDKATIALSTKVTLDGDYTIANLTINGEFDNGTAKTLTIASGGTLKNDGTFTKGTGTVAFAGAGTVSGTVDFNKVVINGGVNFGDNSTISGSLDISTGGYVNTKAPKYAEGSTLKYNTGTDYVASTEWYSNTIPASFPAQGIPYNVMIGDNSTTSDLKFASTQYRYAKGNLTISKDAVLNLSSSSGGDLKLGGDFDNKGTFNSNGRAIFFNGTAKQTVSSTTIPLTIAYVINDNDVDLTISSPLTSTNIENNGILNIPSGVTIITNTVSGTKVTTNVKQDLSSIRNWYMSSPVTSTALPTASTGTLTLYSYPEISTSQNTSGEGYTAGNYWETVTTGSFTKGKGYIVLPSAVSTVTFAGTLNTGSVPSGTLTRTPANPKAGFNLVGNPYPSCVNVRTVINTTAALEKTIWYRTRNTNYVFQTYNTTSNVGTLNNVADGKITGTVPPMQAFWVRVAKDYTSASFSFENSMRSHLTSHTDTLNAFKVKAVVAENKILRLNVANTTSSDETVLYFNANASDTNDIYDSNKWLNNGTTTPNLYTTVGSEKLVINGMNAIPYDVEIPLTVEGNPGTYTFTASEFSNFATDDKIQLIDKVEGTTDLNLGNHQFSIADGEDTAGRFSIIFRSAGSTTAVDTNSSKGISIYSNSNGIHVSLNNTLDENASVRVFNAVGQQLVNQHLTNRATTVNGNFNPGVYVVKVSNGIAACSTQKIVIK